MPAAAKKIEETLPENIDDMEQFMRAGIQPGALLHLGVVGGHRTDAAVYIKPYDMGHGMVVGSNLVMALGIVVRLDGRHIELMWGDIFECWQLHGPIPEDAARFL